MGTIDKERDNDKRLLECVGEKRTTDDDISTYGVCSCAQPKLTIVLHVGRLLDWINICRRRNLPTETSPAIMTSQETINLAHTYVHNHYRVIEVCTA